MLISSWLGHKTTWLGVLFSKISTSINKIPDFSFTNHIMSHIGHKYNNVQADGGVAL
jgi:hypothetical protein